MTKLDQIVEYAKTLPVETQNRLASELVELMKKQAGTLGLTNEEIREVKRALANPHPEYADAGEVFAALGANFS
ncbi:MAG TPA: hypothetical protein ENK01_00905 [Hellea balneolensis]|uniref:Uncharacterized protein n=1 Tax=Hellea balneolensis TaxID=287478 RepID=A0A7V5U0V6_9PROT|nr:hypothetical protein [Hellea balneolensis]